MAGSALTEEAPGGRASKFLDAVVAFVVAVFQPIFHVLVSVISPSNPKSRDQQHRQHDNGQSASETNRDKHHDASTAASHDGELASHPASHPDHDPKTMAPLLQNQPSAANQSHLPMETKTNGQGPVKAALRRPESSQVAVKQENVPANGTGGPAKPARSVDRDLANADTHGPKYRAVGDEQAQENRQDQLTLPPPVCEPGVAQNSDDGGGDGELEDPATAAERAIHHGFMNQALDMVCHFTAHLVMSLLSHRLLR